MEDRDDDKLSSSLPETLHAHIIRPNDPERSDEPSSTVQDRQPAQRQTSRSQFTSSLTPATFPNSRGSRGSSSQDGWVSPDIEDSGYNTKRVSRSSAVRGTGADARFAHPPKAASIPHGRPSPGSSEPPSYHQHPNHSYTFPAPLPNQYYGSSQSTFQWPEGGAGPSSLSRRARGPGSGRRAPEVHQERGNDDNFGSTHDIPVLGCTQNLQPRPVPEPVSPFFSGDITRSRENSPYLYGTPYLFDDSRYLLPPHHLDPASIRHRSLPSQRREDRSRSGSSSSRHAPGILVDDRPIQRASSYSLPPLSALLTPLRQEYYRGPQLPRLVLPERTGEMLPMKDSVEGEEEHPIKFSNLSGRGKRKRGDTKEAPDERKAKTPRKIYVACDFCRGRKLRCDGTKPSCANCSTRTLECKYEDHPRRRGPGKAPKGTRSKKSEGKGRKGKRGMSEGDREVCEQASALAVPGRDVFEPSMMLPGHPQLEAVYAPRPYSDRPSASNSHREGPEAIPEYQFRSSMFEERLRLRDREEEEDDQWSAESGYGYGLPPSSPAEHGER